MFSNKYKFYFLFFIYFSLFNIAHAIQLYELSVEVAGNEGGSIVSSDSRISCGRTCTTKYEEGSVVTITAKPKEGYVFGGWATTPISECSADDLNPVCEVSFDLTGKVRVYDQYIIGYFDKKEEPVVTSITPTEAKFKHETIFTITGTNLPNTLVAWIDECRDPNGKSTLQVNHLSDTKQTFNCIPSYTAGKKDFIIKDKPNGKVLKTGAINIKESNLTPKIHTLKFNVSGKGTFNFFIIGSSFKCNGDNSVCTVQNTESNSVPLTIIAKPKNDYKFVRWTGISGCNTNSACDITVTSDMDIGIVFAPINEQNYAPSKPQINAPSSTKINTPTTISITLGTDLDGSHQVEVKCSADSSNYTSPNYYKSGYKTGGSIVKITDLIFNRVGSKNITCTSFDDKEKSSKTVSHTINVTPKPSKSVNLAVSSTQGGIIFTYEHGNPIKPISGINCGSDCSENYTKGVIVKLAVEPNSGYKFIRWGGDCASNANALCSLTIDANKTVSAIFEKETVAIKNFKLSISVKGQGTVTSPPSGINCTSNCSKEYKKGTTIKLTAKPKNGYIFDGWSGDCAGASCEIRNIESDKSVTATFKQHDSTRFKIKSITPKEVVINKKVPTIFEIKGENLPEDLKFFIPECENLEILVKSKVQYFVQCIPKHTRGIKRPIIKTNEGIVITHNLLLEFYLKVAIDAGHGQICTGNKPSLNKKGDCLDGTWQFHRGKYTYTGDDTDPSNDISVREDELTLNIALRVKNLLISEPFIKVYLTRDTNHSPYPGVISSKDSSSNIRKLDTAWRRDQITRESPSLSFSIHTNGGTDLSYGTETWYRPFKKASNQSEIDKPYAMSSHAKMTSLGLRDRKIKNNSWKSNIQNIGEIPNFLVEVAFHSNTKRNINVEKTDIEMLGDSMFLYNVSNKLYNLVIETADIKND